MGDRYKIWVELDNAGRPGDFKSDCGAEMVGSSVARDICRAGWSSNLDRDGGCLLGWRYNRGAEISSWLV
jgi:hypothetical protein